MKKVAFWLVAIIIGASTLVSCDKNEKVGGWQHEVKLSFVNKGRCICIGLLFWQLNNELCSDVLLAFK